MTAARLQWRPLAAGELDHERLWLGVTAAGCALAATATRMGLTPPPCLFHLATGYPCVGCGSTRAVLQLVRGNVGAAFMFNPLMTVIALGVAAYCIYAAAVLALGLPRFRVAGVSARSAMCLRLATVTVVAANWWWVLAHGM